MRILHVIPAFYPATYYGGALYSSLALCRALAENGMEVRVLTTDANGPGAALDVATDRAVAVSGGLSVRYCRRLLGESVSPTLLGELLSMVRWADLVHLTAAYSFPTIPTLGVCRVLGKPLVWSPRGALQRWAGSTRPQLKALWELACRVAASKRTVLHVTSGEEARESRERLRGMEAVVIPNGIDIPDGIMHERSAGALRLLFLGRLHPKKGIENLLTACKRLQERPGLAWSLAIAGVGDAGYAESIRTHIEALGLAPWVTMLGEVVGAMKPHLFEQADLVVVPSFTENFGIVVVEALAHGVPVITSKGTPWRRVEEIGCGLWVDNDPGSLAKAIELMSRMPLRDMGQRGRAWMETEFSWNLIARSMEQVYRRLLARQA